MERIFEIGKPIPKVWLHFEFDLVDTMKYLGDNIIETKDELDRLVNKYLGGENNYRDSGPVLTLDKTK